MTGKKTKAQTDERWDPKERFRCGGRDARGADTPCGSAVASLVDLVKTCGRPSGASIDQGERGGGTVAARKCCKRPGSGRFGGRIGGVWRPAPAAYLFCCTVLQDCGARDGGDNAFLLQAFAVAGGATQSRRAACIERLDCPVPAFPLRWEDIPQVVFHAVSKEQSS